MLNLKHNMKIPILYIPTPKKTYKKYLYIERKYFCKDEIIPIGCDCHVAYMLVKMNLRKYSLPFDWLDINSLQCLDYVSHQIKTNFKDFLTNLSKNENGNVISDKFPCAEFVHEKKLIESTKDKNRLKRRINRLHKILEKKVVYLCVLKGETFDNTKNIDLYYTSLTTFLKILKPDDKVKIYIRYDDNFDQDNFNYFYQKTATLSQVTVIKYFRDKERHGVWGNEEQYPKLFEQLGFTIKKSLPRIKLKNEVYH